MPPGLVRQLFHVENAKIIGFLRMLKCKRNRVNIQNCYMNINAGVYVYKEKRYEHEV